MICTASAAASALTLFSGFGLGTLLLPVFVLFFPAPAAIVATAVVHLLNNLFKLTLVGRYAHRKTVFRFGIPALGSAFLGAWLLAALVSLPPLLTYRLWGADRVITPVNAAVAVLMAGFSALEILPRFQSLTFEPRILPIGGILSGFFGGLSGHQGALRGAFLVRCGLSQQQFIGTSAVIASLVDVARLSVYRGHLASSGLQAHGGLLASATLAAFLGAWVGSRFIEKATLRSIQILVAVLLLGIAVGLGSGMLGGSAQ